ncbi:MAG TPA: hypothetical protein VE088_08710 [Gaiellaceae bacterium]|nr:hypothetical protein [Gaiellaceae bacterium]
MVVSLIALFVALGGTTYAATSLPKNSVGTKQLKKNAVTAPKIKKNAVTSPKIKNGAVTAAKINTKGLTVPAAVHATTADSATTATSATSATNAGNANTLGGLASSAFLRSNATAGGDLTGTYPNPTVAAGAITASKLATITTVTNSVTVANNGDGSVTATCPTGSILIGGGAQPAHYGTEMTSSRPSGNGWLYQGINRTGGDDTLTVFALCLSG